MLSASSSSSLQLADAAMASATVAVSCSATYSVFIMPPAVSSSNSSSSLTSVLGSCSISSRISCEVSSSSPPSTSAASSGAISSTMSAAFSVSSDSRMLACILGSTSESASAATSLSMFSKMASRSAGLELLDDVGQVGRVHVFEQPVGDVQAQAALRVGLEDVAKLPADGVRRNARLQPADPARRNRRPAPAGGDAADADIHLQHPQQLSLAFSWRTSNVTSLTRTTLRPCASMICWSSRSRAMRSMYSSAW